MTDHIKAIGEDVKLVPGLEAAIRAAKLALFVIRKQNVMPNSSWEDGFNKDLAIAEAALTAAGEMWKTSYEFKGVSLGDENSPRIVTNAIVTNAPAPPVGEDVVTALKKILNVVSYPVAKEINPRGWNERTIDASGSEYIAEIAIAAIGRT